MKVPSIRPARRTGGGLSREDIRKRRVARLERRWHMRKFINLFILWHLSAIIIWLTVQNSSLSQRLIFIVKPYVIATGMTQNWSMFSPNPDTTDLYMSADIHYKDGTNVTWDFPRMVKLGYFERYERERFRKLVEVTHVDADRGLWPSMAIFAARQNYHNKLNPPTVVILSRHFRTVPAPGQPVAQFQSFVMLKQPIFPSDLQ